ncbi:MAG: RusA family crossover junction endodeoxyribonuclease [Pseudonocardia sp.]|nr:RusA family crossover junction endodeoxyribonuclease [Pseudonocardia sp.]
MMTAIEFTVLGTPTPQGSKRPFVRGGRAILVEERKEGINTWRGDVMRAAQMAVERDDIDMLPLFDGPVFVTIEFRFTRPKGHWRTGRNAHLLRDTAPAYPVGRRDVDKLQRSTFDALTTIGLWRDDGDVVDVHASKAYADLARPGATIRIQTPNHVRAVEPVELAQGVL